MTGGREGGYGSYPLGRGYSGDNPPI